MSIALVEFGCPSYEYVKRMTWAEFLIRLHGFKRQQERDVSMLRELAWVVYTAPHQDPKKMKKSIDTFWPMKKKAVSKTKRELMIEKFKAATVDYLKEKGTSNG